MENPETPVRILVVDDEPDIRNILHILLSSRGYEVDEAENGLRAVELVRAQPDYDLIILDIMMPGMDGVSACAEIRQHSVAPILFLTAKAQPTDMSDAYGSGGDDYLIKPFSNHELFLRVDSLIRRYRVYHGKGDAPTVIDALEINRDKGTTLHLSHIKHKLSPQLLSNKQCQIKTYITITISSHNITSLRPFNYDMYNTILPYFYLYYSNEYVGTNLRESIKRLGLWLY